MVRMQHVTSCNWEHQSSLLSRLICVRDHFEYFIKNIFLLFLFHSRLVQLTVICQTQDTVTTTCAGSTCSLPTEHIEGHDGFPEVDVVLASSHLTAVLPRVFLGNRVYCQRRSFHLRPSCVGACGGRWWRMEKSVTNGLKEKINQRVIIGGRWEESSKTSAISAQRIKYIWAVTVFHWPVNLWLKYTNVTPFPFFFHSIRGFGSFSVRNSQASTASEDRQRSRNAALWAQQQSFCIKHVYCIVLFFPLYFPLVNIPNYSKT